MDVRNCKGCGRLFNIIGTERLCPECKAQLEDKFLQVKEYLNENPNSSVDTVASENDVSTKQIRQWIREERLTLSDATMEGIECENCGALIKTGRFCEKCKTNLSNTLSSAIKKPSRIEEPKKPTRDSNKMRFLQ